jgi:hypothetical protein
VQDRGMIPRLPFTFVLAAFTSIPALAQEKTAPAAEKRTLLFHRAEIKGAKYELSATASLFRTTDVTFDDSRRPAAKALNLEVSLDGTLEVTEVTPKSGLVRSYNLTVRSMSLKDGATAEAALEPGAVISAKAEGKRTVFLVKGSAATGNLEDALREALPEVMAIDEPLDNLYAPPGPVADGEKWTPDPKKVAEALARASDTGVDATRSTITVTSKGLETVNERECDAVLTSQTLTLSKVAGLPEGAKLKSCTVISDSTKCLFRDTTVAAPAMDRNVIETELHFTIPRDKKEFEVTSKIREEVRRTMKPVK